MGLIPCFESAKKKKGENNISLGCSLLFICNNKEEICIIFLHKSEVFDACEGFVKIEESDPSQVLVLKSLLIYFSFNRKSIGLFLSVNITAAHKYGTSCGISA